MQSLFQWLAANEYVLVFVVVLGAVLLGRVSMKGYGLGIVASAIALGTAISASASAMGVTMAIDDFTQSIFYALFMYGLGLRLGPSLAGAFTREGLLFAALATICSAAGLALALALAKMWNLPAGAAGGVLAGAMTAPAAIGAAQQAFRHGAAALPAGVTLDDVDGMIAFSFALTCICGTFGMAILCRHLPRWWGIDVAAEARKHEDRLGVSSVDESGLTGYRPLPVRAYRVANEALTGRTVRQFAQQYPQYKVLNVLRSRPARYEPLGSQSALVLQEQPIALAAAGVSGTTRLPQSDTLPPGQAPRDRNTMPETTYAKLGACDTIALRQGDIVTLGASLEDFARIRDLIGPEVRDAAALNVPIDAAEVLVTNAHAAGKELVAFRNADFVGQVAIHHIERGGVPLPLGLHVKLERSDVLFVAGMKAGVERFAATMGRIDLASTSADLVTLALGMALGLALGAAGLGNAVGLLASGAIVAAFSSRIGSPVRTSNAARDMVEKLGLAVFIAIVGIDAGAAIGHVSAELAMKLFAAGLLAATLPPIAAWTIGLHAMKMNAAILAGAVAGARSCADCAREAAQEMDSSVPWIGFPVAYAVSGVLLTLFGYAVTVISS